MRELPRPHTCPHSTATCPACRSEMRDEALRQAPGKPIILLRPAPVTVRSMPANALAYTVTDVLIEWDADMDYHLRWEASWLVHRVQAAHKDRHLQEAV